MGPDRVQLHAQMPARRVYERAGYEQVGGAFVEQGIEHVTMEKRIA